MCLCEVCLLQCSLITSTSPGSQATNFIFLFFVTRTCSVCLFELVGKTESTSLKDCRSISYDNANAEPVLRGRVEWASLFPLSSRKRSEEQSQTMLLNPASNFPKGNFHSHRSFKSPVGDRALKNHAASSAPPSGSMIMNCPLVVVVYDENKSSGTFHHGASWRCVS